MSAPPLSTRAFFTLLLLACLFGGNHVAARVALDHGANVVTAVAAATEGTGPARRGRRVTGLVQDAVSAGVESCSRQMRSW